MRFSTINGFKRTIKNYIGTAPASTETEPTLESQLALQTPVAPWGKSNNFPKEIDDKLKKSTSMESGFQTLTEFSAGIQLNTYFRETDSEGKSVRYQVYYQPFEEFRESYPFEEVYLQRAFYNFWRYANAFVELSLDANNKIVRLFSKDSPWCRLSTINPKIGLSEHLYISAQWPTAGLSKIDQGTLDRLMKSKLMDQIPLIDYRNPIEYIKKSKPNRLAWHIKDYSPGNPYYGQSSWYPILENGWIDVEANAPKLLKSYYDNLITIARHIELNEDWVKSEIEDFDNLADKDKIDAITKIQEGVEEHLTGSGNAFKTLFTMFRYGQQGAIENQIKINDISNPIREANVIADLKYASSIVQQALRIDDSLTGNKTTGSLEADAGSEKRHAGNLLNARLAMVRKQILYPLIMMKNVNEWDPRLEFQLEWDVLVTADKSLSGIDKTVVK
jgi:hypothetical protein